MVGVHQYDTPGDKKKRILEIDQNANIIRSQSGESIRSVYRFLLKKQKIIRVRYNNNYRTRSRSPHFRYTANAVFPAKYENTLIEFRIANNVIGTRKISCCGGRVHRVIVKYSSFDPLKRIQHAIAAGPVNKYFMKNVRRSGE